MNPKILTFLMFLILPGLLTGTENSTYHKIKKTGRLRIGISQNYPILNREVGKIRSGVEIKLAYGFASFLGVDAELVPLPLTDYMLALKAGEVDILISGLSRTLKRASEVSFSEPYIEVTPAALVDQRLLPSTQFGEIFEERPITTLQDLKRIPGLKIGVRRGSAYQPLVQEWFPGYKIIIYKGNDEGITMLAAGKIQAMVHDSLFLNGVLKENPKYQEKFRLLSGGNRVEVICAGIPFGDMLLKQMFDVYVAELKRTGQLKRWIEEYSR